ncbi:MOSC domain-containing protein [Hahella sp. CCB-MM4]|uniref:MOSC domain-containing protein n=1 Tax=Hahella sp. (strain CCB-MM4) TaxID=1926491 RepID=UPI000B9A97ED|nr:MOSC domain-containing protein [Hahella sp. CCB-MM4]OZG71267.1 MOSC domain-containing protein [Hahella sp. CCB-MM4]
MTSLHVTELNLYPVKSCAGVSVDQLRISEWGPEGDRRYMLVDAAGKFVTGRKFPQMVLLKTQIHPEGISITSPKGDSIMATIPEDAQRIEVEVWRDKMVAAVASSEINDWLSRLLGQELKLVHMPEDSFRQVDREYYAADQRVAFSDGYPVLVTNESSLAELNGRLEESIVMKRFRPNIVVNGTSPWEEDDWNHLRIGEVEFRAVKPCSRCVFTTVDPMTAEKGKEPLRTLAGYRRKELGVIFGQNLVQLNHGVIKVGDSVEIIG